MSAVFKKFRGKRITPKDKNWSKGTWYIYKRMGPGRIIHKAIKGAQTKEQAEAAARKLIEKAFNQRYGIADNTTTFRDFGNSTYTQYVQQRNVNKAAKFQYIRLLIDTFGARPLSAITPQDCRNCQEAMQRKGYSASSVNLIMSTASKIFTLACQEGILDRNPMQYVTRLKEPPARNRLLTKEEKERLWNSLDVDPILKNLVVLAVNMPLRRAQLLALTPDAIKFQYGLCTVISSKGREARAIPINTTAMLTLRTMISEGQLPFPLKETGLRKRWKKALKRAAIENFRFHDLRKEFASDLRRKGAHSKTIQDLFGHSSMMITDKYLPPEFEAMREAVNSLDEVSEVEGVQ